MKWSGTSKREAHGSNNVKLQMVNEPGGGANDVCFFEH